MAPRFRASWRSIFVLLVFFIAAGCGGKKDDPREAVLPNVLFILTDEHRFDLVGCYGNEELRTPHLDRLAADGVRFDRFYVAAPLCSPSRASFLSGLYPHQSGVMDNRDRADFADPVPPTVATTLRDAGYKTAFVGKAHMGGDPKRWGFERVPVLLPGGGAKLDRVKLSFEGETRVVDGPATRVFVDETIRFIEEQRDGRWFIWLSTRAAHRPYVAAEAYGYDPAKIGPPPGWPRGQELSDHDWAGYYATVTFLDEQIGRVLETLDRLGMRDNTLVFFAGDNGSMYGSHGEARKEVWYDECTRTPAILRWPGTIDGGGSVGSAVSSVDFLPTLRELCGLPRDERLEGVSFLPAAKGAEPLRTVAFSELERRETFGGGYWRMVRDDRYKYVRFDDGTERLYDFEVDPWELTDFTTDEGYRSALEASRGRLEGWLGETR